MGKREGSYVKVAGRTSDCAGRNAASHSISHVEGSMVARTEFVAVLLRPVAYLAIAFKMFVTRSIDMIMTWSTSYNALRVDVSYRC